MQVSPEGEGRASSVWQDRVFVCVSQPCKCSNCVCGCEAWFLFFLCPLNGVAGPGKVNEAANERKNWILMLCTLIRKSVKSKLKAFVFPWHCLSTFRCRIYTPCWDFEASKYGKNKPVAALFT